MALKVGLTGGIGTGKTKVASIFEAWGIPVLNADTLAKQLMQEDEQLKAKLIEAFGKEIYEDGVLQREKLAKLVFGNTIQLQKLNQYVHPAVKEYTKKWFEKQTAPYAIKEAAIMIEANAHKDLDFLIGIDAPLELRIARVMQRDQTNREAVLQRMEKQMDNAEKMKLCDYVINNDGIQDLEMQCQNIHQQLLAIAHK